MKKLLAIVLAAVMAFGVFAFTGCSDKTGKSDFKVGAILIGDENEGYTYAHIQGIEAAKKACNLSDDQIIYKYNVTEDEKCYEAAVDLAEQGCKLIIANSFGHEDHLIRAAKSIPTLFSATQPVKRLQSIPSLTTFSTILTASTKLAMFPASLRA